MAENQPTKTPGVKRVCNSCGTEFYTSYKGKKPVFCYTCMTQQGQMMPVQMVPIQQGIQGQMMPVQMVPIQQGIQGQMMPVHQGIHGKNYEKNKRRKESARRQKIAEKEQKAQNNDFSVLANNLEDMREQMEELKKMRSELEDLKNIVEEEEKGERKEIEQKDNFQTLIDSFSEFNSRNDMIDIEKRKSMIVLITDFLEKSKVYDSTGKMDTVIKIIKMMK